MMVSSSTNTYIPTFRFRADGGYPKSESFSKKGRASPLRTKAVAVNDAACSPGTPLRTSRSMPIMNARHKRAETDTFSGNSIRVYI